MELLRATRALATHSSATDPREALRAETYSTPAARVGDTVLAQDGALGRIERVIRSETSMPVYVVVAVRRLVGRRYPVIPWSLVTAVDRSRRRVYVRGRCGRISQFSETLPLVV